MNWQPITTAPKDFTNVLALWEHAGQWFASIAFYREVDENLISLGWRKQDEGWWAFTNSFTQEKIEPTHWIALPELPKD